MLDLREGFADYRGTIRMNMEDELYFRDEFRKIGIPLPPQGEPPPPPPPPVRGQQQPPLSSPLPPFKGVPPPPPQPPLEKLPPLPGEQVVTQYPKDNIISRSLDTPQSLIKPIIDGVTREEIKQAYDIIACDIKEGSRKENHSSKEKE